LGRYSTRKKYEGGDPDMNDEVIGVSHKPTVVIGTVGQDCHVVGISVLRHALETAGCQVAFLGALTATEEFIAAARETAADAIFVSSLYGMGRVDCAELRAKCQEAGIGGILLYIGGVLVTDPEEWAKTESLFKDLGFDRVYPPGTKPQQALDDLRNDIADKAKRRGG
jgi:methylaspartate mutase sigma subunit